MVSHWKVENSTLRCSFLSSVPLICTALSFPGLILWLSAAISPFAFRAPLSASSPLFPERLLSRSHLRSEMNLLLPVGWVWTANEREICSYREKVSHAPGLKNQPRVTMEGGRRPTRSAALAANDCWHPVWQSQNHVLFLLNKRRKKKKKFRLMF